MGSSKSKVKPVANAAAVVNDVKADVKKKKSEAWATDDKNVEKSRARYIVVRCGRVPKRYEAHAPVYGSAYPCSAILAGRPLSDRRSRTRLKMALLSGIAQLVKE